MGFIAGAGMTNVDLLYTGLHRLPGKGEEVYSDGFALKLGGGLPATLILLSRLGINTKIATRLGDDIFSVFAEEQYTQSGVTPLKLGRQEGIPLNVTSAMILPDDRSFVTYGSGSMAPTEEEETQFYEMAKGATITLMQPGGFTEVYRQLQKEGSILVMDSGWDDTMSLTTYGEYLALADYYTPNRLEAMKLTGADTPEEAAKRLRQYFDRVVVKLDRDGCIGIDESGESFTVPAVEAFKHMDSTGAGDAFLAGFCYGLYHGYSLKQCIAAGNVTGGKAVTAVGALGASCTEEELQAYLQA